MPIMMATSTTVSKIALLATFRQSTRSGCSAPAARPGDSVRCYWNWPPRTGRRQCIKDTCFSPGGSVRSYRK